jgi:D-cysteine desulfhydrase
VGSAGAVGAGDVVAPLSSPQLRPLQRVGKLERVELGRGPTPVRPLTNLQEGDAPIWMKDDGVYGRHGGNKTRKLEWILADVIRRGRRTIITAGALGTNHGLAVALYGRELGIRTALILVDQPVDDHIRRQLELLRASGARLYFTHTMPRSIAALPFLIARNTDLRHGKPPYFLTVGGSTPIGCIGYVEAGLELGRQVAAGEVPEPSHVVVALGSGGTAAGLLAGMRLAGLRSHLIGIQVNNRTPLSAKRVARLASRTVRLLRRGGVEVGDLDLEAGDLTVERRFLGGGYGHATHEGAAATALLREREGVELEPVYTAKAFAGLLGLNRERAFGQGPVLYWHTYRGDRS